MRNLLLLSLLMLGGCDPDPNVFRLVCTTNGAVTFDSGIVASVAPTGRGTYWIDVTKAYEARGGELCEVHTIPKGSLR